LIKYTLSGEWEENGKNENKTPWNDIETPRPELCGSFACGVGIVAQETIPNAAMIIKTGM
jgi:hypothetical protein